jgi:hypothetical protein
MRFLKHRGKALFSGGLGAVLGALLFTSVALGAPHHPTGEFAQFSDCPLSNPAVDNCVYSVTSSGSFTVGTKTVPIVNPVTLQGGFHTNEEVSPLLLEFKGAEDGNTLSKTPQPVPGGLLGITAPTWWPIAIQEWFNKGINSGLTGVSATVELAAPATSIFLSTNHLIAGKGTALTLPVKVHLENALLGSACYIGSSSSPLVIELTTGTSGKVTGSPGTLTFNKDFSIATIAGGKLVSNTFSAPGATGCGGFLIEYLLDPLVNSILGVPAGSGSNTAILEGKLQTGFAESVKASE